MNGKEMAIAKIPLWSIRELGCLREIKRCTGFSGLEKRTYITQLGALIFPLLFISKLGLAKREKSGFLDFFPQELFGKSDPSFFNALYL